MFYIILIIAGVVLAVNRKQQASAAVETPATVAQSDTVTLPHFADIVDKFFSGQDLHSLPRGPGIGAPLNANNPSFSNVIVSGPNIYKPGGPPPAGAPVSAPASGGGPAGGTTPSGTGGGGLPPGVPTGPRFPNTL